MAMKGLTWSSLKKHYSLIPLFVVLGMGVSAAILYPLRLALKAPDVTWNSRKNPEPWNEYADKQYKFLASPEVAKIKSQAPKY